MLRDKVEMINGAHLRIETRMPKRSGSGTEVKPVGVYEQPNTRSAKSHEYFVEGALVVTRLVRASIRKIRPRQLLRVEEIIEPGEPERLKVKQMPSVLLRRPLAVRLSSEIQRITTVEEFLETDRRSTQPRFQVRKQLNGIRKAKCASEPRLEYLRHRRLDARRARWLRTFADAAAERGRPS